MPCRHLFCRLDFRTGTSAARLGRRIELGITLLFCMAGLASSQISESNPSSTDLNPPLLLSAPEHGIRAYPRLSLGDGQELRYLGTFSANAKYRRLSKLTRVLEALASASRFTSVVGEVASSQSVPPSWMILPARRVVEDFDAPAYAARITQPNSNLGTIRDAVVTLAYGRPRVMGTPAQLTTDSMLRVIVSDPELRSVHVFDPQGRTSFSIVGDQGRRLRQPAGVAVDAEDNIYIADSQRGMVLVYNKYGQFVRYIGNFQGENMYESPTGIAIDRKAGRLYLADTPRNLVFILDLQGNVLKRVGRDRSGKGIAKITSPTRIALSDHGAVVFEEQQSEIQLLDLDGNRAGSYRLVAGIDRDNGVTVDRDGNLYVSYVGRSIIGVYKKDGTLIGSFGQPGSRMGEFQAAKEVWVDASNRVYVADTGNARVQVFQVSRGDASRH